MHVLEWTSVLLCPEMAAVFPTFSAKADTVTEPGSWMVQSLIYSIAFDAPQQRVLFSGLEGKVRFMELNSGNVGDLLIPPDPVPLIEIALLPDRSALVCSAQHMDFKARKHRPMRLQVWSYPALCRAAGIGH
jgi:hypothetical protein